MIPPFYFLGLKAEGNPQLKLGLGLGTLGAGTLGRLMVGRGGWGVVMRMGRPQ